MDSWPAIPHETPIDPSGLKLDWVKNRADLNIAEAENVRQAFVKYLSRKPSRRIARFDITWCVKLHSEMFGDVWDWAGAIRNRNLSLGVDFAQIRGELQALLDSLREWPSFKMELIEQATRLHHGMVHIHPFENGNGRWSRLLANIFLKQNDHAMIIWPEATIGTTSEIRTEYIAAIKASDAGDFAPLIRLQQRYV